MRRRFLFGAAALGTSFLMASTASATVSFEQAAFTATVTTFPGSPAQKTNTVTTTTLPSSDLSESLQNPGILSYSQVTASASFTDATAGHVAFDQVQAYAYPITESATTNALARLYYKFSVDSEYIVRIDSQLTGDADSDIFYNVYADGGPNIGVTHQLPFGAGSSFSESFGPGVYILNIEAQAMAFAAPGDAADGQLTKGSVDFQFLPNGRVGGGPTSGTPEPSSWALMLLGFGSLGAALRARRRAQLRPSARLQADVRAMA